MSTISYAAAPEVTCDLEVADVWVKLRMRPNSVMIYRGPEYIELYLPPGVTRVNHLISFRSVKMLWVEVLRTADGYAVDVSVATRSQKKERRAACWK